MKNRIRKIKAAHPEKDTSKTMEFTLTVRVKKTRVEQFVRDAGHYGLTLEEMTSAMLELEMEGNEPLEFTEVGYHLMFAVIDLYPAREKDLAPLRDAFVASDNSADLVIEARKLTARALVRIDPEEAGESVVWQASLLTKAEPERAIRRKAVTA